LWVEDDGKGFDAASPKPRARGLRNQQYRCDKIGATLQIASGEQGTRMTLAWSLPVARSQGSMHATA